MEIIDDKLLIEKLSSSGDIVSDSNKDDDNGISDGNVDGVVDIDVDVDDISVWNEDGIIIVE